MRYRAHVAFSTAYDILQKLEQVHNRRKAFIYVSNGYDFDPFSKSRAKAANERFSNMMGRSDDSSGSDSSQQRPRTINPFSKSGNEFAAADLAAELSELTREANRANATIYTIDPRGLVGGPDLDETKLDTQDWQDHIRETQSSLRVIAELTGGFAVVNQNDFDKALKRIDAETSDYYVLGLLLQQSGPAEEAAQHRDPRQAHAVAPVRCVPVVLHNGLHAEAAEIRTESRLHTRDSRMRRLGCTLESGRTESDVAGLAGVRYASAEGPRCKMTRGGQ